ncbi:NUDIX hydrolase domain-like protein [Glomus cerebriforme]|uniref:NUDIX hydrolase domain-like protein n=1 Tax=Glomus cerebriforme TaxID=658196 RepID=A0A397SHQ1_9GLOM|nr:NUDIX hydrolase domain-like protein [Glomus cerebriforme]
MMVKLISVKECLNNLRNYKPKNDYLDISYEKRAAVLIPLIIIDDELEVLLTVRSTNLSSHAGEIALPGGKVDENDESIIVTAFREAEEEVGIKSGDAEYLTYFEPFISRHKLLVTPVAALIINPFYKPIPNPSEVSECFTVPLRVFISKEHHLSSDILWNKKPYRTHYFTWNNWNVFGFCADICVEVAKIAFNVQNVDWKEMAEGQLTRKEYIENLLKDIIKQQNKSKL